MQPSTHRTARAGRLLLGLLWLAALPGSAARADEIEVKGKALAGQVVRVTPKGLDVETEYGKGKVLVAYEDVTALRTDAPFTVLHGDDGETIGRLVGVREGALLVGEDAASATAVPVAGLLDSVTQQEFDDSELLQLRSSLRYWTARYDLSFAATDATTNTTALLTGFEVERKKSPTRLLTTGSYRFGTKDDPDDEDESTTENELLGTLRGEYDLTKRLYSFAAGAAEYDEVESLSLRTTPKLGLGVHLIASEEHFWDVDLGGAWVYERYFGGQSNGYFALAFGTEGSFTLPFGSKLTIRGEYLPAVDDWAGDYLLRGSAGLAFPMTKWLSLTTGVVDQYDSTPAEDSSQNSLTATAGLALVF